MAAIINSGRAKIAMQQGNNVPLIISKYVFANIDGLDVNAAVDLEQSMPDADDIVYEHTVTAQGYVAPDQVVYSIILGPSIGDFYFNWVGLVADDNTLIAVAYTPTQYKYKTVGLNVGNTLTRNFLTQYNNAQAIAGITVAAEAWQIDFIGRLDDMDESHRQDMADFYGDGFFINDGFSVYVSDSVIKAKAGYGHVGGLRIALAADQKLDLGVLPKDVYVDAYIKGGAVKTTVETNIVSFVAGSTQPTRYTDGNNLKHFRVKIATVNNAYAITDRRKKMVVDSSIVQSLLNLIDEKANTQHSHVWSDINGMPTEYPPADHSHGWGDVTDKPATYPPAGHSHTMEDIEDLKKVSSTTDTTAGRVLTVGYRGIGKYLDLRNSIFTTGKPADLYGTGVTFGFSSGGALGVGGGSSAYGTLIVNAQYGDASGSTGITRSFQWGNRLFLQTMATATAWTPWVEVLTGGNFPAASFEYTGNTVVQRNASGSIKVYGVDCYSVTSKNNVSAYSDATLKDDVRVVEGALDKLCSIRGVTYSWIESGERGAGVIAQEVQKVLPEVVQENEGGILSVAYGNMAALYIEAIKELKGEIDQLKEQVATLQGAE